MSLSFSSCLTCYKPLLWKEDSHISALCDVCCCCCVVLVCLFKFSEKGLLSSLSLHLTLPSFSYYILSLRWGGAGRVGGRRTLLFYLLLQQPVCSRRKTGSEKLTPSHSSAGGRRGEETVTVAAGSQTG